MTPDGGPAPWEGGRDGAFALRAGAIRIAARLANTARPGRGDQARPRAFIVGVSGSGFVMRPQAGGRHFAGMTLARDLGVPILSFADPAPAGPREVGDVARLGAESHMDVIAAMSDCVAGVARALDARPVLVGGSGAGFIGLNILRRMSGAGPPAAACFANAPLDFSPAMTRGMGRFVRRLGGDAREMPAEEAEALGRQVLIGVGLSPVGPPEELGAAEVLFLQNRSDPLAWGHLGPFMGREAWARVGPRAFAARSGRLAALIGDWGEGHVKAPRGLMLGAVRAAVEGLAPPAILPRIDAEAGAPTPVSSFAADGIGPRDLEVAVRRRAGRVAVTARLRGDGPAPRRLDVRLGRPEGKAIDRRDATEGVAEFLDPSGDLRVTVVAQDGLGSTILRAAAVPADGGDA